MNILKSINIRKFVFMIFIILGTSQYLYTRHKKKKQPFDEHEELEELDKIYTKDKDGLYPWEKGKGNSPDDIPKDADQYHYDNGPKRGRW